jgi:hypothetical protein
MLLQLIGDSIGGSGIAKSDDSGECNWRQLRQLR